MPVGTNTTARELYGHEEAKALLRRLDAHTLLFVGPERVGRRRVARWYAALLNCERPSGHPDPEPCGHCASCTLWRTGSESGNHPDYREVAPELVTRTGRASRRPELRIDQLVPREGGDPDPLSRWLERRPRFRKRVGVIDGADALNGAAANAFLKFLEEPPSYATIILIAGGVPSVLPTIASRSVVVRFGAVPPERLPLEGPTHPAARLGRAGELLEAVAHPEAFGEALGRVEGYLVALSKSLEEALEAADALEKAWYRSAEAGTEGEGNTAELLRASLSRLPPHHYARALIALERCEAALAAYAAPGLAISVMALEMRRVLRED